MARSPNSIVAWLRNFLGRRKIESSATPEFMGAPKRLRLKTYSSESGLVYQYVYRGYRFTDNGADYTFSVTTNRKNWTAVPVRLRRPTIDQWQHAHERELRKIDLYAIAKQSLFEEFDRAEAGQLSELIEPAPDDITRHLRALGLL